MGQSIEDLLKSMLTFPETRKQGDFVGLENTREIWRRIGEGDSFQEMGFENEDAKNKWLSEWCAENPYSAINN